MRESAKDKCRCRYSLPVFLDSASHRVTPHYDAGSRKVPLAGIAFAGIPGFRIKCGMTGRVFLDTASYRVTPHHDAGSIGVSHPAQRCGVQRGASCGYCLCWYSPCQYSWIPHQAPGHPAPRCGVQCVSPQRASAAAGIPCPGISGYRVVARYDVEVRNDREGILGYRVTPGHPAQRCGVHLPVFLDTAS